MRGERTNVQRITSATWMAGVVLAVSTTGCAQTRTPPVGLSGLPAPRDQKPRDQEPRDQEPRDQEPPGRGHTDADVSEREERQADAEPDEGARAEQVHAPVEGLPMPFAGARRRAAAAARLAGEGGEDELDPDEGVPLDDGVPLDEPE
jgi:hypothetical protein